MARLTTLLLPLALVAVLTEYCFSLPPSGLLKDAHSIDLVQANEPGNFESDFPSDAKSLSKSALPSDFDSITPRGGVKSPRIDSKVKSGLISPAKVDTTSETEDNDDDNSPSDSEDLNSKSDSPSESDLKDSDSPSSDTHDEDSDKTGTDSKSTDEDDSPSDTDEKDSPSDADTSSDSKDKSPSDTDESDDGTGSDTSSESDESGGRYCGFPGAPLNGLVQPQPDKPLYEVDEYISYICTSGAVVVGHSIRRCRKDGSWTGSVPVCDRSACPQGKSMLSHRMPGHEASLAVDRNLTTCAMTTMEWPRWWRLEFDREVSVRSMKITKSNRDSYFHEFAIYLVEIDGRKLVYHACYTFSGRFKSETMIFLCNKGKGVTGRILHIEDKRITNKEFDVCEVEIFFMKGHYECGEPDRLAYSTANWNVSLATYSCLRGYKMTTGDRVRTCNADGTWSGVPPRCEVIECQYPEHFGNGYVTVGRRRMGSLATYHCDDGYVLTGNSTRVCTGKGEWSLPRPHCVEKSSYGDCGRPSSSFYEVVNETVAELHCPDGSVMAGDDPWIHCRNGSWSKPQGNCLDLETGAEVKEHKKKVKACDEENLPSYYVKLNESVAEHQCPHEMLLYGHPYLYCHPDGSWSKGNATCYYEGEHPEDTVQKMIFTEALLVALVCAGILAFILVLTFFFWLEEGVNEDAPLDRYEDNEAPEDVVPIIQVDSEVTELPPKPVRPARSAPEPPETLNHVYDTPKPIQAAAKTEDPLYAKVDLESKRRAKLAKESSSEEQKEEESPPPPPKQIKSSDEKKPPSSLEEEKEKDESPKTKRKPFSPKESEKPTESSQKSEKRARGDKEPEEVKPAGEEDKKASPKQVRRRQNLSKGEPEKASLPEDTNKTETSPTDDQKEIGTPKSTDKSSKEDKPTTEDAPKRTKRRPLSPKSSEESPSEAEINPSKEEAQDPSLKRPPRQRRNF